MSIIEKIKKVARVLPNKTMAQALLRHRVAATTEHLDALAYCAPRSILDVGANKGQFSTAARAVLPETVIHAFEPLPRAAAQFERVFAGDALTTLHRCALGADERTATFYVADRDDSSSLLKPGSGQMAAFGVGTSGEIEVSVKPLGRVLSIADLPRPIMLKIDVQGAELEVLRGIADLAMIDHIYVELSFVELYEHQALFEDVRVYLAAAGYDVRGIFNQAFTPKFGPTQADCLFTRSDNLHKECKI